MADFVDSFNDTDGVQITAHTGETPASMTWALQSGPTGNPICANNRFRVNELSNQAVPLSGQVPFDADYDVYASFKCFGTGDNFGPCIRAQTSTYAKYQLVYSGGGLYLYKRAADNGFTLLAGPTTFTINAGETHTLKLTARNVGADVVLKAYQDGVHVTGLDYTDPAPGAPYTSVGRGGFTLYGVDTPGDTSGVHIEDFTLTDNSGSALLACDPTAATFGNDALAVTLTGTNTAWTAGTPGTPTFTLAGGTGASIVSQAVANATSASLVIDTGTAVGTLTITDPSTGKTCTITLTSPFDYNATNWKLAGNVVQAGTVSGEDALQFYGANSQLTVKVTTPELSLKLLTDTVHALEIRVDGGSPSTPDLTADSAWHAVTLFSGLSDTAHTVEITQIAGGLWAAKVNSLVATGAAAPAIAEPAGFGPQVRLQDVSDNYIKREPYVTTDTSSGYSSAALYTDARVKFRAKFSTLIAWAHQQSSLWGLVVDGVEVTPVTAPAANRYGWVTLLTGYNDQVEHLVEVISAQPGGVTQFLQNIMCTGTHSPGVSQSVTITSAPIIVFFGDSKSAGGSGGFSSSMQNYPQKIALGIGDYACCNLGRGGRPVASPWETPDDAGEVGTSPSGYTRVTGLSPVPAIVWSDLVTNDEAAGAANAATFETAYKNMFNGLNGCNGSGTKIIGGSPIHKVGVPDEDRDTYYARQLAGVAAANAPAHGNTYHVADMRDVMTSGEQTDGTHPNATGAALYAARAISIINTILDGGGLRGRRRTLMGIG